MTGAVAGPPRALAPAELDELEGRIDGWLGAAVGTNPAVLAVERGEPGERRWYVRLAGEAKSVFAVWLTLRQRTLHYETYVAPWPPRNVEATFELLLRRNARLHGASFQIGDEDAIFLAGETPATSVDEAELDRILGSLYDYVEATFPAIIRLAFAPPGEASGHDP